MIQTLFVVLLTLILGLAGLNPAFAAAKKKLSKADKAVQADLEPIAQDLSNLSLKASSRGLFSPSDMSKALDIKLKLLQLISDNPTSTLLPEPAYQAGRLFQAREMYDDAYDFYNFVTTNFATSPYAVQSKVQIQRMKQLLGESYFADSAPAEAAKKP